jgi:hypothetical protein
MKRAICAIAVMLQLLGLQSLYSQDKSPIDRTFFDVSFSEDDLSVVLGNSVFRVGEVCSLSSIVARLKGESEVSVQDSLYPFWGRIGASTKAKTVLTKDIAVTWFGDLKLLVAVDMKTPNVESRSGIRIGSKTHDIYRKYGIEGPAEIDRAFLGGVAQMSIGGMESPIGFSDILDFTFKDGTVSEWSIRLSELVP